MSWQPEIDELRRREALARRMGGPDKIKRQHDGGKLTVRERIERLLDPGSFHEIGAIAGKAEYDEQGELIDFTPSNFVMGRGRIDGRPVVGRRRRFHGARRRGRRRRSGKSRCCRSRWPASCASRWCAWSTAPAAAAR